MKSRPAEPVNKGECCHRLGWIRYQFDKNVIAGMPVLQAASHKGAEWRVDLRAVSRWSRSVRRRRRPGAGACRRATWTVARNPWRGSRPCRSLCWSGCARAGPSPASGASTAPDASRAVGPADLHLPTARPRMSRARIAGTLSLPGAKPRAALHTEALSDPAELMICGELLP